mgnify:CR=1 FL=1
MSARRDRSLRVWDSESLGGSRFGLRMGVEQQQLRLKHHRPVPMDQIGWNGNGNGKGIGRRQPVMADQRPEIRSIGSRLRLALLLSRALCTVSTSTFRLGLLTPRKTGLVILGSGLLPRGDTHGLQGPRESEWDVSSISLTLLAPGPPVSCLLIGDRGVVVWRCGADSPWYGNITLCTWREEDAVQDCIWNFSTFQSSVWS